MTKGFAEFESECNRLIEIRLAELRAKPFQELASLTEFSGEEIKVCGTPASLVASKQVTDSIEVKVIIEIYWKSLIFFTKRISKGFAMDVNGNMRELIDREYW